MILKPTHRESISDFNTEWESLFHTALTSTKYLTPEKSVPFNVFDNNFNHGDDQITINASDIDFEHYFLGSVTESTEGSSEVSPSTCSSIDKFSEDNQGQVEVKHEENHENHENHASIQAPAQSPSSSKPIVWAENLTLNTSGDSCSDKSMFNDVEEVRKRMFKRKRRNIVSTQLISGDNNNETVSKGEKIRKNTLAARRYRQRQAQEIETFDKRMKELEAKFALATEETKRWKLEAEYWKNIAENRP